MSVQALRSAPALHAHELVAGWAKTPLLRGLNLRIAPGERVAVLGPNGAGKTTLFDTLSGRLRPRSGTVALAGRDISVLPLHRRARLGLGYVPQEPTVFGDLSVRENLQAAVDSPAGRRTQTDPDRLERGLTRFALGGLQDRRASVLSGGERRRVEVLRALLCRPVVLLLDEPFAGLDPKGRAALSRGLAELPAKTALVVTDHAADDVLDLCQRVVLLIDGGVVFDGPRADFDVGHPAHRRYFGG
jgi:lipopolysaccharide export system ATP-binding protein